MSACATPFGRVVSGAGIQIEPLTAEQRAPCVPPQLGGHPKVDAIRAAEAYAACADKKDDVTEYAEAVEQKFNINPDKENQR